MTVKFLDEQPKAKIRFLDEEPQRSSLLTDPVETLKRSGGEFVGSLKEAVTHPVKTVKSLGNLAIGGVQKVIPGEQGKEPYADAIVDFYKQRYGSIDQAKQTALEDPVGFASDLSIFLTGGGAVATKAGQISKVGKLVKAGQVLSKTGKAIDPLAAVTKTTGKVLKRATQGKKIAPFAKSLDNPVIKAAEKLDVDLPASSKSTSRVVPLVESLTAKGFFGEKLSAKVRNASDKLVSLGDEIIQKTGASDDLAQAGEAISKGADKFRKRFFDIKEVLYEKANFSERGKSIFINTDDSVGLLDELINKKESAGKVLPKSKVSGLAELKEIRKKLNSNSGAQVKATDVKNALEELNQSLFNSTDPVITGNKAQLRKLSSTLSRELDSAVLQADPTLAKDIQRANKFYSLSLDELNSHFGKQIFKYKDQPDKILPAILKSTTSKQDVKRIFRLVGKDNVSQIQSAFMRELFDGAKNSSTGLFTPQGISREIKRFGRDKLEKVLSAEQLQAIDNIETLSSSLGKFEKVAQGSQTAFNARIAALVGSAFGVSPGAALQMLGADAALSSFVSSSAGQNLLTSGLTLTGRTGKTIQRSANTVGKIGRFGRVGEITSSELDQ